MFRALVRKEIRELLPLVVPAVAIELLLVGVAIGLRLGVLSSIVTSIVHAWDVLPFINDSTCSLMITVGGVLAVAIGLWQTLWESARGTIQYLLHRPVRREYVLGVKLLVGGTLSLVITGGPVLLYALWAATPDTHASPFFWGMTLWAWLSCLGTLLLYLGAFLSGLRPGGWYASRFFPLFGALLVVGALDSLDNMLGPSWRTAGVLIGVPAMAAVFVSTINYVANTCDLA